MVNKTDEDCLHGAYLQRLDNRKYITKYMSDGEKAFGEKLSKGRRRECQTSEVRLLFYLKWLPY